MQRKFKTVGVGGTFDEFHKGHRALLLKAFEVGQRVVIGVSSDEFAKKMNKHHLTATYEQRTKDVREFLRNMGLLERGEIIPINDVFGGLLLIKNPIEALVVSKETEPTGIKINEKRNEIGLPAVQIIVIDMIPSENHVTISTTRIRDGEIDREGHMLKRKQNR
jgi:pantetheine-phosphate adenylyltransferase